MKFWARRKPGCVRAVPCGGRRLQRAGRVRGRRADAPLRRRGRRDERGGVPCALAFTWPHYGHLSCTRSLKIKHRPPHTYRCCLVPFRAGPRNRSFIDPEIRALKIRAAGGRASCPLPPTADAHSTRSSARSQRLASLWFLRLSTPG